MASPIFSEASPFAGDHLETQDLGHGDVMTLQNTLDKSFIMFALTVAAMVVGWFFLPPALLMPVMMVAFIMSLVAVFKRKPNPALYIATSGLYGMGVGALSGFLESQYPGVVSQAIIGTVAVLAAVFLLYRHAGFRTSPKMNRIFWVAIIGYLGFSLVNFGLMAFGATESAWGLRTEIEIAGIPLGVILGVFAVALGAYSLVMDFEFIEEGVARRLPAAYGWTAGFGLVMTIVWIYVEILRLLSILRGN